MNAASKRASTSHSIASARLLAASVVNVAIASAGCLAPAWSTAIRNIASLCAASSAMTLFHAAIDLGLGALRAPSTALVTAGSSATTGAVGLVDVVGGAVTTGADLPVVWTSSKATIAVTSRPSWRIVYATATRSSYWLE